MGWKDQRNKKLASLLISSKIGRCVMEAVLREQKLTWGSQVWKEPKGRSSIFKVWSLAGSIGIAWELVKNEPSKARQRHNESQSAGDSSACLVYKTLRVRTQKVQRVTMTTGNCDQEQGKSLNKWLCSLTLSLWMSQASERDGLAHVSRCPKSKWDKTQQRISNGIAFHINHEL